MVSTRPPIPARQYIFPVPSLVIWRAAWSDSPPTSDAPEQGKMNLGAEPQLH